MSILHLQIYLHQQLKNIKKKTLLNWMYSWMKLRCVTYLQYKYSRYIFMKILYYKQEIGLFGVIFSNNVANFVRKHILIHEKYFFYCFWNEIRHYSEDSNTSLEGTNYGLKHSSISTLPGLSMNSCMAIVSIIASSILSTLICNVKKYETKRIQEYEWVVRKLQRTGTPSRRSLPDFDVLKTVTVNRTRKPDIM